MSDFNVLKTAVAARFQEMKDKTLYRSIVHGEALWALYLAAFPPGTDPTYRKRSEHDCSACRSFVKAVGNCVTIQDGSLVSIWDITVSDPVYQAVADALSSTVKTHAVDNLFFHPEAKAGVDKNFEQVLGDAKAWSHLFVNLPASVVKQGKDIGPLLAESRSTHDVMLRGLSEITPDAVATVLDLVSQNGIYRGEEHRWALTEFEKLKREFDALSSLQDRELFCWSRAQGLNHSIARMRNTSIGTLLVDLSEGKDVEEAVKSFETKVAPQNYKRPTAVVTKGMIEKAKATIVGLGLLSALERRYATLSDITVNNILHVNRSVKPRLTGNVFDDLTASLPEKVKNYDKVEEVTIDRFIGDVLPRAESVELLLENRHAANLVSLIAPVDPTAGSLFKWGNNFTWDYNGGLADSDIRQAVQARGGRVDGVFRFSHQWNHHEGKRNTSLMDLHVFMPGSNIKAGNATNDVYGNIERVGWNHRNHVSGGTQDVDYTQAAPEKHVPVENITFPRVDRMNEGVYVCKVHNWALRIPTTSGFSAEIEFGGEVFQYDYPKPLGNKEWVTVAEVTLKDGKFSIKHHLPESTSSRSLWGLSTQTFHKVNVVMLSPNHWDGQGVGNRHHFFMLDGATREGAARGFYNEFLKNELTPHGKAFEMVGSRMNTGESADQLTGIGFSSTQRNSMLVRVKGAVTRTMKVTF